MFSGPRRSELYACSVGSGMPPVSIAIVWLRPMGFRTFSSRRVARGFLPIIERIWPRIMKLVSA